MNKGILGHNNKELAFMFGMAGFATYNADYIIGKKTSTSTKLGVGVAALALAHVFHSQTGLFR